MADKKDKDFLLINYGKQDITEGNTDKIREIIKKCGAFNYCREKFYELIENGKKEIGKMDLREDGKKSILELADYVKSLL